MTSTHINLPAAALGAHGSTSPIKSLFGSKIADLSSLDAVMSASMLGPQFADILNQVSLSANGTGSAPGSSNDPSAQLTTLVRTGMPLSTIRDRIVQRISASVQTLLAGKLSKSDLDRIRSSLSQSLANALAPPGNAPPGTAAQEVTALAMRLQQLVNAVARDAKNIAGQQNEIAGSVLDAKSAKELPAQRKTNETPSTLDVSSLVRSLLASAVSSLQSQPPSTTKNQAPAANAMQSSPSSAPASATPDPAPAPVITMANAPDLLARMLVRAAGADQSTPAQGNMASNPSVLTARLAATFAHVAATAVTAASNDSPSNGGQTWHGFDRSDTPPSAIPAQNTTSNLAAAAAAPVSATQFANLVQNPHASQAANASFDANAVIEQMVKSMAMRTNSQGDSEIRLRLQPENLGEVTMKISVQGSQINANVVAQNVDVKNALVANQHQLARSLADSGLTLSGFSVDVSGGDAGRDRSTKDRTSGFGRRYTVHELPGRASTETPALSSLGPPLIGGSNLELFSYLA